MNPDAFVDQIPAVEAGVVPLAPRPLRDVPRRILHIINGEHFSGAERVQDLLALRLPEFGYEVGFACLKAGKFLQQRQSKDAQLFQTTMRFKFDLSPARHLANVIRLGDYEMVHAHTVRAAMIGAMVSKIAKVPFVYHVHSPASKDSTRRVANHINAFIEALSLSRVSRMICVSDGLSEHMAAEGHDPKLLAVVPNGVPVRGPLLERATPSHTWTLGTIALFRPRKGTEVLIEALSILRGLGYDVRLRAVGPFESNRYESKMKRLAEELRVADIIEWTGFTSDINAELDKMDVMILPSLFGEGLPMVVVEAMAAGVPVVATNVQGVPEVLRNGSGLIAAPGCAKNLAQAIRRIIRGQEDWSTIRRTAWQRQADRFSDRSMAAGVAAVYDQILGIPKA